ncbi:MAG: polysaccharide deacetylase family protein [Gammaproteobacteria bacterium]|nr:polysaccharide deacetylase family protein [Gammaproteobacteria bacterium]
MLLREEHQKISLLRGVRRAAARILRAAPLHVAPLALWRTLLPKTAVGVCYHMVSQGPVRHLKHYRFLDPKTFESDLDYLSARFEFVTYEELARRRAANILERRNPLILTFDDGFAECATVVAPLLRRRALRCVFFVITDLIDNQELFRESAASLCIDAVARLPFEQVRSIMAESGLEQSVRPGPSNSLSEPTTTLPFGLAELDCHPDPRLVPLVRWLLEVRPSEAALVERMLARLGIDSREYLEKARPYLTSEQLRQLHADGFTIGAHSRSHRRLQELPRTDAEGEIIESCRIVRDITGQASVPFAFPYFGGGLDRSWLAGLRERHDFIGLFFDTDGVREDEPFVVQRVFGERFSRDRTLDAILRRAWADPAGWRRRPIR